MAVALKAEAEKFQPFLSDLKDIQKVLANDVTQASVKEIRSTVSSANWNYKFINRAINDAMTEMKKMEKELSPEIRFSGAQTIPARKTRAPQCEFLLPFF